MSMPAQKPGVSEQAVCTPDEFLRAVESLYGPIVFDLAASVENAVVPEFYGPGSALGENSLELKWPTNGLNWLNPPFGMLRGEFGFAAKAFKETILHPNCKVAMLIPAAVATNWFADYVHGFCVVRPIRPRLTFKGHTAPFPKDLALCLYNVDGVGFSPWAWKT